MFASTFNEEIMNRKAILGLLCFSVVAAQLFAADGAPASPEASGSSVSSGTNNTNAPAISSKDIDSLRKQIAEQEKEIEKLQKAVSAQREMLETTIRAVSAGGVSTSAGAPMLVNASGSGVAAGGASRTCNPGCGVGRSAGSAVAEDRQHLHHASRIYGLDLCRTLDQRRQRHRNQLWQHPIQQRGTAPETSPTIFLLLRTRASAPGSTRSCTTQRSSATGSRISSATSRLTLKCQPTQPLSSTSVLRRCAEGSMGGNGRPDVELDDAGPNRDLATARQPLLYPQRRYKLPDWPHLGSASWNSHYVASDR